MTSEHIKTRQKIKDIASVDVFYDILDKCVLSDDDKEMLKMHYVSEKDLSFIADTLGYSESTIKYRHKKALKKLGNIL